MSLAEFQVNKLTELAQKYINYSKNHYNKLQELLFVTPKYWKEYRKTIYYLEVAKRLLRERDKWLEIIKFYKKYENRNRAL